MYQIKTLKEVKMTPLSQPTKIHISIPSLKIAQIKTAIKKGAAVTRAEFIRSAINDKLEKFENDLQTKNYLK